MKVSYNELNKFIKIDDIPPYDLANKLTYAGIEVESIKKLSNATNLIIGQVLKVDSIEGSNHLHACKVNIGNEILDIVCGAPNVRENLKVIVAKVGAKLNNITIKKTTIMNHESNGMLCSLVELGVDKKFLNQNQIDGIEELDDDAIIGNTNVLEYLGLNDYILDLKLLANRSDCNSLINVAKEVGSLYQRKLNDINLTDIILNEKVEKFKIFSNTKLCQKFYARIIKNLEIKESPKWLKYALRSFGIRSINNIVDIGNYVMILTGQPLHMYDYDKLESDELICELSNNEKYLALDEQIYNLEKEDLVIKSKNQIESLAGVMGSLKSSVSQHTKSIVIESALFNPKNIRLTSLRLGLSSESSLRFVKGIDPLNQEYALQVATYFICLLANPKSVSQIIKYDNLQYKQITIKCSYSYINNRLGTNFSNELIEETLKRVYIQINKIDEVSFTAFIPHWRIDITSKADLSEEVIRILGYDNVKSVLPNVEISLGGPSSEKKKENLINNLLVDNGFYQILTYSLVNNNEINDFDILLKDNDKITITNPLTVDHSVLRKSLIPSLLNCAIYNLNRKINNFKLFEFSNLYANNKNILSLSCLLAGNNLYQGNLKQIKYSYFDLKGIVENIFELLGISKSRYSFKRVEEENEQLNFGNSTYLIINNKIIGYLGEIHPNMYKKYQIKESENILILELNMNEIFSLKTGEIKSKEISKYPDVKRDLALVCNKDIESNLVEKEIKMSSTLISDVYLFDVFIDEIMKLNNQKSLAYNLTFTSFEKTLNEEEINFELNKAINNLKNKFGIKLRQ